MAELATIARPYAEAFPVQGQHPRGADLSALSPGRRNWRRLPPIRNCANRADNPNVSDEQLFDVITAWPARHCLSPHATSCVIP